MIILFGAIFLLIILIFVFNGISKTGENKILTKILQRTVSNVKKINIARNDKSKRRRVRKKYTRK